MRKVFLGGTCNNSIWRESLIKLLDLDNIEYVNPVVKEWNIKNKEDELIQRESCDFCLYTITPKMKGLYSIAEVIDDSNKRPEKTIFCLLNHEPECNKFSLFQINSLDEVGRMVGRNGGKYFTNLEDVANYLNKNERG